MIEKKRWLLITFHTTSEAMAMERRCQEAGLAGRLIPVPRTIRQSRDGAVFCVYAPLLPVLGGKGLFSK